MLNMSASQIILIDVLSFVSQIAFSFVLYVLMGKMVDNRVSARMPKAVTNDTDARIVEQTNRIVAERMEEIKSHVADVRELVRKITDIQQDLVAATQAIVIVGEKFENMQVCPYGKSHECKPENSP